MGFKLFGGVAHFRVLPLSVPVDIRFITNLIGGANEVIKTLFERCRFLFPVWSYGGLNFWKAASLGA